MEDDTVITVPPSKADFRVTLSVAKNPESRQWVYSGLILDQICIPQIEQVPVNEILEKWQAKVAGHKSSTVLYTFTEKTNGKMRFKAYAFEIGAQYYWFALGGKDSTFVNYSDAAEVIMNSFKLLQ